MRMCVKRCEREEGLRFKLTSPDSKSVERWRDETVMTGIDDIDVWGAERSRDTRC